MTIRLFVLPLLCFSSLGLAGPEFEKRLLAIDPNEACAVADFNNDGEEEELITGKRVRGHSGRDPGSEEPPAVYYYTWDSEALEFTRHLIAEGVGTVLFIRTADLDGNGKLDIAVSGKSGTWLLFQK